MYHYNANAVNIKKDFLRSLRLSALGDRSRNRGKPFASGAGVLSLCGNL